MSLDLSFYTSFTLENSADVLNYYDSSATTWHTFAIPAGTYYLKHETATKDIKEVINGIIQASFPAFDIKFSAPNYRQLLWSFPTGDGLRLIDTGDDDYKKLAMVLGLYDNDGDLDYCLTNSVTGGDYTQNTLSAWFSTGGRTYNAYDLKGFDVFYNEIYQTEGGTTTQVAGSRKAILDPLQLTGIGGDAVRGGWNHGTQTVLFTTANDTWTASIWRALNPEYFNPEMYVEIGSTPDKYEWALTEPVKNEDLRQLKPGWSDNFDIDLHILVREVL